MGLRTFYAALGRAVQGAPRVEVEGGRLVVECYALSQSPTARPASGWTVRAGRCASRGSG